MANPKSPEEILGREYDWIASDGDGYIGFFATAGGGYAPPEFLEDTDVHDRAIDAIRTTTACTSLGTPPAQAEGDLSTWTQMAERGIFAFDADSFGGPYRLVAAPAIPVRVDELPESAADIVRRLCFRRLRFRSAHKLSTEDLKKAAT